MKNHYAVFTLLLMLGSMLVLGLGDGLGSSQALDGSYYLSGINHFQSLFSNIVFFVIFLGLTILFFLMRKRESFMGKLFGRIPRGQELADTEKALYIPIIIFAVLTILSAWSLWGTLNWSWDLPSKYFGNFYWTGISLAIIGGLIRSAIVFIPLTSRRSIFYTLLRGGLGQRERQIPFEAPWKFFIPWTILKFVLGIWLFSDMMLGLWIQGGNGITFFSHDTHAIYAELLVLGPPIAGALTYRLFIYIIHHLMSLGQSFNSLFTYGSTTYESGYGPIVGRLMRIVGVFLLLWAINALFGITGQYESLVGPYRHDLFAYMVEIGAGVTLFALGGFLLSGDWKKEIVRLATSAAVAVFLLAFILYYSPDTRITLGFFVGVLVPSIIFALWYLFLHDRVQARLTSSLSSSDEDDNRLRVYTTVMIVLVIVFVSLVAGSVGSNLWLRPQHRQDPLNINADLIEKELALNAFSAGLDYEEVFWDFAEADKVDSVGDIDSLISQNQDTFDVIRLWDRERIVTRVRPTVGVKYLQMGDTDIIRLTEEGPLKQYWFTPKNLNLEEILSGSENAWYNEHKVYTHSIGFVGIDALTGSFVNWPWLNNDIYFGEGPYRGFIYDYEGNEIEGNYTGPTINPSLPIQDVFVQEFPRLFTGDMVAYMNIFDMAGELFPYLKIDTDPYMIIDDTDTVWYSMDAGVNISPSKIPLVKAPYVRPILKILINTETGEYDIYYVENSNDDIILPLLRSIYGDEIKPLSESPQWYKRQLRYPESFMVTQVQAMNTYHVNSSNYLPDVDEITTMARLQTYVNEKDFFEIPQEENLRHVLQTFFDRKEFVSMIAVEFSGREILNIPGIWVMQNRYDEYGTITLIRVPAASQSELRVIGTSVVPDALNADEEVSFWKRTQEDRDQGNMIIYRIGERLYYFVPFYTGMNKTVTLQKVACVRAHTGSQQESINVGFAESPEAAYRNLQLELLASQISGRSIGTYQEAIQVISGETDDGGQTITQIISEMNFLLERRDELLAEGNEVEAAQLLEDFFDLYNQLEQQLEEIDTG